MVQCVQPAVQSASSTGTQLFRVICDRDMEGVVAKQASAKYTPEAKTWVKIKNWQYSQAVGREDFFNRPKASLRTSSAVMYTGLP